MKNNIKTNATQSPVVSAAMSLPGAAADTLIHAGEAH